MKMSLKTRATMKKVAGPWFGTTRRKLLHSIVLMVLRSSFRAGRRAGRFEVVLTCENLKALAKRSALVHAESRSAKRWPGRNPVLEDINLAECRETRINAEIGTHPGNEPK